MKKNKWQQGIVLAICVVCVSSSVLISGCNSREWRKKFVRKKQAEERVVPVIFQDELYATPQPLEVYRQSFVFWESWHDELLKHLADNNPKKIISCAQQSWVNLEKMMSLLTEDKAKGLEPAITALRELIDDMKHPVQARSATRHRSALETAFRVVRRDYHPTKIGEELKKEKK